MLFLYGVCLLIFSENSASHSQAVDIDIFYYKILIYRQVQYNFNLKAIGMANSYFNVMHCPL